DGCEPLLAIADLAGGDWPSGARKAFVEILSGEAAEDNSIGIRLLSDIREIFRQNSIERIFTIELLAGLCDLEPQWLEFNYGKPLSAASLAKLLKPFEIRPRKIRIDERTASGYIREWFSDAWGRYLAREPEQAEQGSNHAGATQFLGPEQSSDVPAERVEESPVNTRVVPLVPLPSQSKAPGRTRIPTARELGF